MAQIDDELERLEWMLIGDALREPQHFGELASMLSPSDFNPKGMPGVLFDAISKLHFAGAPIEPMTIRHELGDSVDNDDVWQAIESKAFAYSCSDRAYYAKQLRQTLRLKRMKDEAATLTFSETLEDADASLQRLTEITAERSTDVSISIQDSVQVFFDRLSTTKAPDYIHFGIAELDRITYTEPGDLVILGGYPNAGKTMLALQFAKHIAATGKRVGFFSLETSTEKLTDRLMCQSSRVPLFKIKNHDLRDEEYMSLTHAAMELSKLNIDLISAGGFSVRDITARALNSRYDVIFIDYLQLIDGGSEDRYKAVTNISLQLHTMSQRHKITVVALAQLRRPEKAPGKKPTPPSMSDFRESGQIEQDADLALLIYPMDPNDNRSNRMLKVGKNKEGDRANIELAFDGSIQTFSTLSSEEPSPQQKPRQKYHQVKFEETEEGGELPF